MYQALIWPPFAILDAGNEARRLGTPLDSKDLQGAADPLIDGVRRYIELGCDFLGRQMRVDQAQAIELTLA
jgi:hypothetical protein